MAPVAGCFRVRRLRDIDNPDTCADLGRRLVRAESQKRLRDIDNSDTVLDIGGAPGAGRRPAGQTRPIALSMRVALPAFAMLQLPTCG